MSTVNVFLRNNWHAPDGSFHYKGPRGKSTPIPEHLVKHLPSSAEIDEGSNAPKVKPLPLPRRPTTLVGTLSGKGKKQGQPSALSEADPARAAAEAAQAANAEAAEAASRDTSGQTTEVDPDVARMEALKAARAAAAAGPRRRTQRK